LFYLEFILSCVSAILSLAIAVYNCIKKNRIPANFAVSAAGMISAALFIFMAVILADPGLVPPIAARKILLSLMLAAASTFVSFTMLYPYLKPKGVMLAIAACLPGLAFFPVVLFTDFIVSGPGPKGGTLSYGAGYPLYCAVITICLIAVLSITGFKLMQYENRALQNDLLYLLIGMSVFSGLFVALSIYLPDTGFTDEFIGIGVLSAYPALLIIMNYAAINVKTIDLKQFYAIAFYWIVLFALLFIPTLLVLMYNTREYLEEPVPAPGIALLLFVYLFLVFKYLSPRIETLSRREYRNLAARVDELFNRQSAGDARDEALSEEFLRTLVNGIAGKFDISSAHLYLPARSDNKFKATHDIGTALTDTEVNLSGPFAELISRNPGILYKPSIYSEKEFRTYHDDVMEYFERNHVEVVLPFLNQENRMIGFLTLGQLRKNRAYSKSLLAVLELYRIQFQQHLANALLLERVRASQVLEHDQMVVSSVKKRILPQKIEQQGNYRISSFYINNSPYGGDYYDSAQMGDDAVALFMSDSSYAGIDSAIILLELYTVLHTPLRSYSAPDKILSAMNWVIATSRFSSKYAAAYCAMLSQSGDLLYSNAAANPMMLYNQQNDSFIACDTTGVPVGVDRASKYETKSVRLTPGSTGILCSDGLVSAIDPDGQTYGLDRIKSIIRTGRDRAPAEITRMLYDDLNRFIRDKKQINDISVILFKFK
jgi:serine phosphatase RsbU (regulator of sigma subunit)